MRRKFRRHIPVIMVTGTNGKTTTVLMTSHILKEFGHMQKKASPIGEAHISTGSMNILRIIHGAKEFADHLDLSQLNNLK